MNKIILVILIFSSLEAFADSEDHYLMRVSWVKTLKDYMGVVEKKYPDRLMTVQEKILFEKWNVVERAWANDDRYNCFFGGYGSTKKSKDGKLLCQDPQAENSGLMQGSCSSGELQCQPVLFGSGLCVPFNSQDDKRSAFSHCEEKFQIEKHGSYDFLRKLDRQQVDALIEMSFVAGSLCSESDHKDLDVCHKVLEKMPDGLKSLRMAWKESFDNRSSSSKKKDKAILTFLQDTDPQDLVCTTPVTQFDLDKLSRAIEGFEIEKKYQILKSDFLKSDFCRPENVVNNPQERPSGVLMADLMERLNVLNEKKSISELTDKLAEIGRDFELPASSMAQAKEYAMKSDMDRAQMSIIQAMIEAHKKDPSRLQKKTLKELADNNIFTRDQAGNPACPFVSEDAFKKAMMGRNNVLSKRGWEYRKKDVLTIVDFSRPSNERRLYVIDLAQNKVLHNTWVGHGHGIRGVAAQDAGVDGLGSSPKMSNRNNSNLSSDGFIMAIETWNSPKWGPSVVLRGIDKNNYNLILREIILHGWDSMLDDYSLGSSGYNLKTGRYSKSKDMIKAAEKIDLKQVKNEEVKKVVNNIREATKITPYLMTTAGCLGVTVANNKHLDLKQRNKSQLDMLKQDLPGTLIFNYSGPEMSSRFLD